MHLKKLGAKISLALLIGVLPGVFVFAADPTVTLRFSGSYVPFTCAIVGNADQTIELPRISAQALGSAGQTAGATAFNIPVLCESGVQKVKAYFENGPIDPVTGNLEVQDQSGGNKRSVQIQLLNGDGTPIRVGDRSTIVDIPVNTTEIIQLPYYAQYYAKGQVAAGKIETYVTYVIEMP